MKTPHITRILGMRGLVVNNYTALRSAVLAGHDVIIITSNMDLADARRIAQEETEEMNRIVYY